MKIGLPEGKTVKFRRPLPVSWEPAQETQGTKAERMQTEQLVDATGAFKFDGEKWVALIGGHVEISPESKIVSMDLGVKCVESKDDEPSETEPEYVLAAINPLWRPFSTLSVCRYSFP